MVTGGKTGAPWRGEGRRGEERRGEGRTYPLDSVGWFAPGGCSTSRLHLATRRDVTRGSANTNKKTEMRRLA